MNTYFNRKSNIELLRIVSQFYIILYHVFLLFIYPNTGLVFYKAIQLTFHIGVIVFVLISGYFGIKPSSKGLIKLLSIFIIYSLPYFLYQVLNATDSRSVISNCLILSRSPLWFVKTYLYLYLISPMLNLHIKYSSISQKWYIITVLLFISCYMGVSKGDDSLVTGKNLPNFILIYLTGNMLSQYKERLSSISQNLWIIIYVILNVLLVVTYCLFSKELIGKIIWRISFVYCSPVLLINSIIFFMIFAQMNIKSKFINWIAKSSFAIYLIHGNQPYAWAIMGFASLYCINEFNNPVFLFFSIILLALGIIVASVVIDKLLTPLWYIVERLGNFIFKRLKF